MHDRRKVRRRAVGVACQFAVWVTLAAPRLAWAEGPQPHDDADLARLLDVEVEGASRYAQSTLDAPAVVRVFQHADASLLGHETVGDLLQRLPGVYLSTNRSYTSFGLRGFNRAGDYNSRTLMTIDGLRVNDAVFDQALPGYEFPIPADWVKRTELIYGPAASVYGSNALLGVANFAMLDGADAPGATVRAGAGSFGRVRAAASYGLADPSGLDLFVGVVGYRDRGEELSFPELASAQAPDGVARGLDGTRYQSLFAKLRAGPWRASFISHERDKDIATGEFDTSFGAPGTHYVDAYRFSEFGWDGGWTGSLRPSARVALGSYRYLGHYRYDAGTPDDLTNIDDLSGRWLDGEAKLQWHGRTNHVVVAGLDWRRVYSARLLNRDLEPATTYLDRRVDNWRAGLYLQDQWRAAERWSVTTGLRLDHLGDGAAEFSPRLAINYRPDVNDAWKFSLGRAFRAPNIAELYYDDGSSQAANPSLGLEHIATAELGWEHALPSGVRVSASVYRYQLGRMIDFVVPVDEDIGQYRNVGRASTDGLDLDIEQAGGAWRWRASMTLTRSIVNGEAASNSPRWLLKGHLLAPLAPSWWLGLEANAVGRRTAQVDAAAYALLNTVLRYQPRPGDSVALRVTNLGDARAFDVATPGLPVDRVPQPRRALTLDCSVAF
ncbi:TonB-dependent receptor plug domain-containing protein [Ideonella sp. YS5]|uniref:TonB-dependent receptor plug domain-containing protein n=1 Tax=Ideonella sp. YS5 TaxID=3453714 RepID=UPI003EEE4E4F